MALTSARSRIFCSYNSSSVRFRGYSAALAPSQARMGQHIHPRGPQAGTQLATDVARDTHTLLVAAGGAARRKKQDGTAQGA
jgi:hypothetical protein